MSTALQLVPLAALTLGIVSTAGGFFLYYAGSVRKRYAAERDFQHLRANQDTIVQMLKLLEDELTDVKTEIIRLTASIQRS